MRYLTCLIVLTLLLVACKEDGEAPTQQVVASNLVVSLHCKGAGDLTVLLLPGLHGRSSDWVQVRDGAARSNRVCAVDFQPTGTRVTGNDVVDAISIALQNEGARENILIVAHSFGGYIAQLLSQSTSYGVVGVVLVDASHPQMLGAYKPLISDDAYSSMQQFVDQNPNGIDVLATESAVKKAKGFGSTPLIVLSRGKPGYIAGLSKEENARVDLAWAELQRDLMGLSSRSAQITAENAGHNVPLDDPDAVLSAIGRVSPESQ